MSVEAGSGEAGHSRGLRVRRACGFVGWLGYFSVVVAVLWAIWDTDGRSFVPANFPAWFLAPAQIAPESLRHEAGRAMCYVSVLVNSDVDSGPCRDVASHAGRACFAAAKKTWCVDERVTIATALWLLLAVALIAFIRLVGSRTARRVSASKRNEWWSTIILQGMVGLTMLGSAYHTALLDDVIILDPPLRNGEDILDALSKRGCSVRSGNCAIDLSNKAPRVLLWAVAGFWVLGSTISSGYRRRKDFVYRPAAETEEES